ncbi:MAG: orotate phosphoribosyltransferase [Nitrospira sp. SB0677_bin_15]|nr:orotate phosphoribosyltransferase [Nitrospira sp. SB0677_bin_15]
MLDLRFMDSSRQLATLFWQYEAFQWEPEKGFVLASGETSPYYVDCRALLAHPDARWLVAQLACAAIRDLSLDAVGGLEIGAIPLATAISDYAFATQPRKTCRTFVVRKQAKNHGLGKRIEGAGKPNDRVLIVDDVLTSGGSLLQAIQAAREAQLHVSHALVIVDRQEQNGKQKIEAQGVSLISLLTLDDLKTAQPGP